MYSANQPESGATPSDDALHNPQTLHRTPALRRLQDGDEEAWDDLLEEHVIPLLSVANAMCDSDAAASASIRQAWHQAQRSINAHRGLQPILNWLLRLTVRACLRQALRDRVHQSPSIESLLPTFTGEGQHTDPVFPWPAPGPHAFERPDTDARVAAQIRRLPPDYRLALILCDGLGLSTTEAAYVADTLDLVVRDRLHRARQGLRTLLDQHRRSPMSA